MKQTRLVIVVPCYNEEEVLPETTLRLFQVIDTLKRQRQINSGKILYVDDGSKDHTWSLIKQYATDSHIAGLKLAHNVGHQKALWAGLEWAVSYADIIISIDADLQDDEEAIYSMINYYHKGVDIVYGVRKGRKTDTFFKRYTAQAFYRLMNGLGGNIVYNHADFRLLSRRALQSLLSFPERNLFLRGMVHSLGYPSAIVYYNRKERFAGKSNYPLKKMVEFALDGITSFSVRPLQYITYIGLFFIFVSILAIVYGLCSYIAGNTMPGWTSLLVSVWFIGGAILLACGIIGEYIGKIYTEVKRRPHYFVEEYTGIDKRSI